MRSSATPTTFTLATIAAAAFTLVAGIFMAPGQATATDPPGKSGAGPQCTCPQSEDRPWRRPKFAGFNGELDGDDQIAALESLHHALTEVGDGSSYVWHRHHGHLSGVVRPTASFKDAKGNVCRHVIVMLSTRRTTRQTEAIACRTNKGAWHLEG